MTGERNGASVIFPTYIDDALIGGGTLSSRASK